MNSKSLKIFTGLIVVESKLSKAAKLQLLNFIQNEATDYQIMALLLDGKIVVLDEQAGQVIEDRFRNSNFHKILEIDPIMTAAYVQAFLPMGMAAGAVLAPMAIAAAIIVTSIKIYRHIFKKAGKACKDLKGESKSKCIIRYKINAVRMQTNALNKGKSICKKSKDPRKCVSKIDVKITKLKERVRKLEFQLK